MTTEAQNRANRLDALRSTGPRTGAGKAASSHQIALRHGLTAQQVVLAVEDPAQFDALRDDLHEEFGPCGPTGERLVEQLASLLWRLRRVPVFEAAVLDRRLSIYRQHDPLPAGQVLRLTPGPTRERF